ncbi:hypothetical protein C1Y08_23020 [Pseudomonas sp. FW306-02-F02-AA]|uniref:Uncharacterized protein n=1 Tax=Pseudomonas fluorescens TaxID=294 RepID=A0A0N9VTL3_PSEFL|nr:hypothetical protein AO353_09460 [Pseudomonas fluorescens]PMZ01912.1 hypothetical protein C1Y07_22600 [Pseudomonas sp. FW306-02-F02-AB]PMZ07714.1 hypothetical protein C1Y06_23080 [Pseudomonas sp. FW306-02-H06C]PMZ13561.1 hypothetical protein C1Y08_23020 [Pseudomonas sp. FW306-02-F02-AA]PMZ19640.1 hypothetical protein C1Y09_23105 [Pseudomonas sp. FW306-02-F08-AA]PMZ25200.1 hypothetical protein C1Y05_24915 [Pseudomonas sp. FW306-02-F04-BA]PMZ32396.1 hypothetical protein C1X99_21685 [Pseudomo
MGDRQTVMLMTNRNDKSGELLGQERRRRWSQSKNWPWFARALNRGTTSETGQRTAQLWCSDSFEFRCEDGTTLSVTLKKMEYLPGIESHE